MALFGVGDGGRVGYSPQSWVVLLAVNWLFFALNLYLLQLTQGIFTKVIQEIARVENSYGQERRCHLMWAFRHGVAALILLLALARLQWGQVLRTSRVWLPAVFLDLSGHNMVPSCLHTFPRLQWPGCQCLQRGKDVSSALASALCFC